MAIDQKAIAAAQGGQDAAEVDLAAIKARCDAATPGPWAARRHHEGYQVSGSRYPITDDGLRLRDAEFIAHARTDLPGALDLAQRLTAENRALRERVGDTGTYDRVLERAVEAERQIQEARQIVFDEDLTSALANGAVGISPNVEGLSVDGVLNYAIDAIADLRVVLDAGLSGGSGDDREDR